MNTTNCSTDLKKKFQVCSKIWKKLREVKKPQMIKEEPVALRNRFHHWLLLDIHYILGLVSLRRGQREGAGPFPGLL